MQIGVPREVKASEYRVALVPGGVEGLVAHGHSVLIEREAGRDSGFEDEAYTAVGAEVVNSAQEVWERAEMILKVKEPAESEHSLARPGQVLFTYFHFAASESLTRGMLDSKAVCIAYETVQLPSGELPLLTPMSEVAGRLSIVQGAKYLERPYGGRGLLLGGVPGVLPAHVVILGGGVVGTHAAQMAAGSGARVTILDISLSRLRHLAEVMPANVGVLYSNPYHIREQLTRADLVVGAVLVPGARAPFLVKREDLRTMLPGAVIVDVAVDQGGCVETTRPTTHQDPIYEVDGIVHYAVTNMPGAVARTSTLALTNATHPYVLKLADLGWREACRRDRSLRLGLNVVEGAITYPGVAEAFELPHHDVDSLL